MDSSSSDYCFGVSEQEDWVTHPHFTEKSKNSFDFKEDDICGEGATCIIYKTEKSGTRIALKRLKHKYLGNGLYRRTYTKEFALGHSLKHDRIPTYWDHYEGSDEVYIVMDFIDGVNLKEFTSAQEGLSYFSDKQNARRFFVELLSVVGYLHNRGIVHCDLKPENIMLRHTDRGVMLIDFEKAYCDVRYNSHGGTSGMSEPLRMKDHPTISKDIEAIGNISEYLFSTVKNFPVRYFRRFRNVCKSKTATISTLEKILTKQSDANIWIAVIVAVCLPLGLIISTIHNHTQSNRATEIQSTAGATDTIVVIQSEGRNQDAVKSKEISGISSKENVVKESDVLRNMGSDFDSRMAPFISEADVAIKDIRAGNMGSSEMLDAMYLLTDLYTSTYQKIVTEYKTANPDLPGIDIELAVARHAERSRASQLHLKLTQTVADARKKRHAESDNNFE